MNSQTASFYTMTAAVRKAWEVVGATSGWETVNDYQKKFLDGYYQPDDLPLLPEIISHVATDVNTLNGILEREGFDIRLDPFKPNSIGVVSILDLLLSWLTKGEKTSLRGNDGKDYQGVRMVDGVSFFKSTATYEPVVEIATKSGDLVYMTVADKPYIRFGLHQQCVEIDSSLIPLRGAFKAVRFPMISYNQRIDISWLLGLRVEVSGDHWFIDQALQQTKVDMDEAGVRVKEAVAIVMRIAMCAPATYEIPDLVINRPFFFWVKRPGLKVPIITGYMSYDCWKGESQ